MEKKSRDDVALRFAESLVAQMLQRSGTEFYHVQTPSDDCADFLVQNGQDTLAVEVKYANKATEAKTLWKNWLNAVSTPDVSTDSKLKRQSRSPVELKAGTKTRPLHLVVVTGNGSAVFADQTMAAMLVADDRTTLSVLERSSTAKRRTQVSELG